MLRAQRDWQAATARIGVAVGNRLPRITITGQYGTQRPDFKRLFGSAAEVYTAQAGISIPLFTGGKLLNEQRAARARADQAKAEYEQTVLTALGEASDALAGVRLNRDQIVAQATQAQALRRAYDLAEQRYRSGVSSYLEVLDAQRGLFTAELALRQVQRQYLVATVQLYRALGGSWDEARVLARTEGDQVTAISGEKARADQVTGKGSKMNDDNTRDRAEIGPIPWPLLLIKLFDWQWLARRLQPPYPTAWDYYFRKRQPCFVIARLKDGKALAGYWGRDIPMPHPSRMTGSCTLQAVYR